MTFPEYVEVRCSVCGEWITEHQPEMKLADSTPAHKKYDQSNASGVVTLTLD